MQDLDRSVALAVKRTLRERWREDTSIFSKFKNAVFVCISEKKPILGKIKLELCSMKV